MTDLLPDRDFATLFSDPDAPEPASRAASPFRSWAAVRVSPEARLAAVDRLVTLDQNLTGKSPHQVRAGLDRAWALALSLRTEEAMDVVASVELWLTDLERPAAASTRRDLQLLRAVVFALRDQTESSLALAEGVLKAEPPEPQAQLAAMLCRLGYWRRGDLASFYALARPTPCNTLGKRQIVCTAYDQAMDAAIEAELLRFSAAKLLAQGALDLVELQSGSDFAGLFPAALLAQLLYEQGDADGAWDILESRLGRLRSSGTAESTARAYPLMARIAARRGEAQFAAAVAREGEAFGEQRGWSRLTAACLFERFELFLAEARWDEAQAAAERLARLACERQGRSDVNWPLTRLADLAAARLALHRAPSRDAVAVIRRLHHEAVQRRDLHLGLQLAVCLVDGLAAIGQDDEALNLMLRLLNVGASVGLCQTILDGGPRVATVLRGVLELSRLDPALRPLAAYVSHLASHWSVAPVGPVSRTSGPLSSRECAVLRLISRGHSNKRIAQILGIAVDTVKTHAKNIFVKLDAANRAEAVVRAERLGLI
jgi:LuxR family maltose regulon positive regulatory protein